MRFYFNVVTTCMDSVRFDVVAAGGGGGRRAGGDGGSEGWRDKIEQVHRSLVPRLRRAFGEEAFPEDAFSLAEFKWFARPALLAAPARPRCAGPARQFVADSERFDGAGHACRVSRRDVRDGTSGEQAGMAELELHGAVCYPCGSCGAA